MTQKAVFWFRRDLRLHDNHGLFQALTSGNSVIPIFIFDTEILDRLENKSDRRVDFIVQVLQNINKTLEKTGKQIQIFYGKPLEIFKNLSETYSLSSVYCNEDYEPSAIKRDQEIENELISRKIKFQSFKDQVHYAKNDILKSDKTPYTVYTPYSKQWTLKFNTDQNVKFPSEKHLDNLESLGKQEISLEKIGFEKTDYHFQSAEIDREVLKNYGEKRDFPAYKTSEMGVHLRFGMVSIRELAETAAKLNETYLKELIWREFFMQILFHFPQVVHHAFKNKYDQIPWRYDEKDLEKWQKGETGFPIVDAGMRELNETGLMHNRVRMICAGFLTKHLLIDWRIGEAYFAEKLLDYDLSANNGNWQWVAGSGCDSAPYFRIFNPEEQQKKFDPHFIYIKKWVKEFGTSAYPKPMIDHRFARERALETYKKALQQLL